MKTFFLFAGLFNCLTAALPSLEERQASACSPVHIFVGRGSQEAKGEGSTGRLSASIKRAIAGTTSEAIDYPALLNPYTSSESKGVAATKEQMQAYAKRCPQSKLVLMGYSQVGKKR